jgi:hypothetical protein
MDQGQGQLNQVLPLRKWSPSLELNFELRNRTVTSFALAACYETRITSEYYAHINFRWELVKVPGDG